ncbi:CBM35 domain-containing protein [Deltaproteobacteria bacterium TL4]
MNPVFKYWMWIVCPLFLFVWGCSADNLPQSSEKDQEKTTADTSGESSKPIEPSFVGIWQHYETSASMFYEIKSDGSGGLCNLDSVTKAVQKTSCSLTGTTLNCVGKEPLTLVMQDELLVMSSSSGFPETFGKTNAMPQPCLSDSGTTVEDSSKPVTPAFVGIWQHYEAASSMFYEIKSDSSGSLCYLGGPTEVKASCRLTGTTLNCVGQEALTLVMQDDHLLMSPPSGGSKTFGKTQAMPQLCISNSGTVKDTTVPGNPSIIINGGATSSSSSSVSLALSATDDTGVTAYYVSENATVPSAGVSGWVVVTSTTNYSATIPFTLSSGNWIKTIYVWFKDAAGNISYSDSENIELTTAITPSSNGVYEAEDAVLSGVGIKIMSDHSGYSGTGFAAGFDGTAASCLFTDTSEISSSVVLKIRYSAGYGTKKNSLYVNGTKIKQLSFPDTASWEIWADVSETITIIKGVNTVEIRRDADDEGTINIDRIELKTATLPTLNGIYEAEDAILSGGVRIMNGHLDYFGSGFTAGYEGMEASCLFLVKSPVSSSVFLKIRYAAGNGTKKNSLYVNGLKIKQITFSPTNSWDVWAYVSETISLIQGDNTIEIRKDTGDEGYINVDRIELSQSSDSRVNWSYPVSATVVYVYPALGSNNEVYTGGNSEAKVFSISQAGTKNWEFTTSTSLQSQSNLTRPFTVGNDGVIYIGGTASSKVFALNQDGTKKWETVFEDVWGTSSGLAFSPDNTTLYTLGQDGKLHTVRASDGFRPWDFKTEDAGGNMYSTPVTAKDGTIYLGGGGYTNPNQKIYAINSNGTKKWEFKTNGIVSASLSIGTDGTVYGASQDGYLYALYSNGTQKWKSSVGIVYNSSPVIDYSGNVYIGGYDGNFYSVNQNGILNWKFDSAGIEGTALLASDGNVYVGVRDGTVYCLSKSGQEIWHEKVAEGIYTASAIDGNGNLYYGTGDGKLVSIKTGTSGLDSNAQWPMFGGDVRHSGKQK